ncbi:hypothetical protein GCM10010399_60500 [Dactylosporangium fulvum]|uniref:Subtilase-type protease inhibitor n=1 Tax=Dactylosporangium fulvum TaxID=53359 RepID=A0ABY5W5J6_9ACTN|nr:subtilase-type protease inhibitor [Dactylosporangium fulvum]UWP84606.1 subtilase-type protease inhibitor [Dactylosporangium fulvum]
MGAGRLVTTAAMLVASVAAVDVAAAAPALAAGQDRAARGGPGWLPEDVKQAATVVRPTQLVLTVAKGESGRPSQRRAVLTCSPAGGTHKQARNACAELVKVGGDFTKLRVNGGACTMQYDPVTVTAVGRWKGRKIDYRQTFGNGCTLSMNTGPVFSL